MKMPYSDICNRGGGRLTTGDCEVLDKTYREIKPSVSLEIGSMDGCSSMLFGLAAKELGITHYCIEPNPRTRWKANIRGLDLEHTVTLVMASSPWLNHEIIPKPIDYLFIDGDHRTRWAVVDYHFWAPFVRVGGCIAFHDWTGSKGVAQHVRRAVALIQEDAHLTEVAKWEGRDRGTIVFRKEAEDDPWGHHKPINWPI